MKAPAIVLLVDDVLANRETLRELLDASNLQLIDAPDGPTALRLAAECPPDLVLLDVMMPGMDGLEVCRRLRADPRLAEVPVIMLTALVDRESRLAGIDAGADDFITKPFNGLELRARVRTITRLNRYRRLHETQAALRDSEKHFRALFELGPVAIYSCDAAGLIRSFNRCASALWGREPRLGDPAERFCGAFRIRLLDGSVLPHDQSLMAEVLSGRLGAVHDVERIIERPDGSRVPIAVSIVPVKDEAGTITGAINCSHDLTARKAAELTLRENEQWLKAIFEQAAVGVVQIDRERGRLRRFNQRFCDFLGYTQEEMALISHREISHPEDLAQDQDGFEQLQRGDRQEYSREKRYIRKDGAIVWASIAVSSFGALDADANTFIAIILDITERKRLDEHFLQGQKMEALGQFSGGIAHDFNNILAAIGGYTELSQLVLRGNPEVRENLAAVMKSTNRAADLVSQILTFSRQESPARSPLQLQPLIAESIQLMRATIPSTITFEVALAANAPPVLGNANQIHQILMNLGINASHAMKDRPGRLRVELEQFVVTADYAATKARLRHGPYVRISVGDTGSGMDPATLRRIFEPFFTTKPPGSGTGLGLSVVHGIMDSHDGAITVHSQPGEGTVFRLYFPVHNGAVVTSAPDDGPPARGHGEAVLAVDDEEMIARLLQKTLCRLGYRAEFSTDPVAALALVQADPYRFQVVVTDQTMPGLSGLDLARQLREIQPELPVILLTGYSLSLTAERIEEAGIRQLMLKPVTVHALGKAVHEAVTGAPSRLAIAQAALR